MKIAPRLPQFPGYRPYHHPAPVVRVPIAPNVSLGDQPIDQVGHRRRRRR